MSDRSVANLAASGWRVLIFLAVLACALAGRAGAQDAADQVLKGGEAAASVAPGDSLLPPLMQWLGDFDGMRKRRVVRILVPYSRTFYFIDKGGKQFGMTYEIGHAFDEWINKKYKTKNLRIAVVFIPVSRDRMLPGLVDGTGDIAAGNLTVTPEREKLVDFSDPIAEDVREIVVTGPAAPPLASIADLAGQEVFARPSSSYFEHLKSLSDSFEAAGRSAIALNALDEDLEDEDAL